MAVSNKMRRVVKELGDIQKDKESGLWAEPYSADNVQHIHATFHGPPGTPYEGGTFSIEIRVPSEYPFKPPMMRFNTKIWHPNISSQTVCMRL